MLRRLPLILFALAALLLLACTKSETPNTNAPTANTNKAAPGPTTATTSGGEKIGVAECDEYLDKYEACITNHVPEAARATFNSTMKTTREQWRKLAANPTTKGGLAAACKQALESARTSMKMYNCTF